jgi:hypothetical protein
MPSCPGGLITFPATMLGLSVPPHWNGLDVQRTQGPKRAFGGGEACVFRPKTHVSWPRTAASKAAPWAARKTPSIMCTRNALLDVTSVDARGRNFLLPLRGADSVGIWPRSSRRKSLLLFCLRRRGDLRKIRPFAAQVRLFSLDGGEFRQRSEPPFGRFHILSNSTRGLGISGTDA